MTDSLKRYSGEYPPSGQGIVSNIFERFDPLDLKSWKPPHSFKMWKCCKRWSENSSGVQYLSVTKIKCNSHVPLI